MEDQRQCRRCLLKDMSDSEYYDNVRDFVESLSEDVKAPEAEYLRRLELCQSCDDLVNGMCRLCGCFVEVRAAKRAASCARSRTVW